MKKAFYFHRCPRTNKPLPAHHLASETFKVNVELIELGSTRLATYGHGLLKVNGTPYLIQLRRRYWLFGLIRWTTYIHHNRDFRTLRGIAEHIRFAE